MLAIIDFLTRLVGDVGRLVGVFANDVLGAGDPLSIVSFLFGGAFVTASVLVLGYLAVGALLDELGVPFPSLGGRGQVE